MSQPPNPALGLIGSLDSVEALLRAHSAELKDTIDVNGTAERIKSFKEGLRNSVGEYLDNYEEAAASLRFLIHYLDQNVPRIGDDGLPQRKLLVRKLNGIARGFDLTYGPGEPVGPSPSVCSRSGEGEFEGKLFPWPPTPRGPSRLGPERTRPTPPKLR